MGRFGGDGDHACPCSRWQLGQLVQRLQMRLGQQRDHRNGAAPEEPLDLGKMTEARHRRPPVTGLLPAPHDRGEVVEQHPVDANRELPLQLPGEEVELGRAAFHQEDFDRLLDGCGPGPGHAEDTYRHIVGGHPERGRPDHHVLKQSLAQVRRRAGGRRGNHEDPLTPSGLDVSALLEVLDDAGDGIRVDGEEPGQLADAGQGLLPRDTAALDSVLQLLGQLPPDRDRAMRIHSQVERELELHCISILVHID